MSEDVFDDVAPWWRRKNTLLLWVALAGVVWWFALRAPDPVWLPGQTVGLEPEQIDSNRKPWKLPDGSEIEPLAEYRLEARVLGREDYSDAGAFLSPMDLALGWGPMSDETVIKALNIRQGGRWYNYSWEGAPPVPVGDIITNSANTHLIPATPAVAKELDRIVQGDRVRLVGALVAVRRSNGWRWRSSLTRKDTGGGACELMWVESVEKLNSLGLTVDDMPGKR